MRSSVRLGVLLLVALASVGASKVQVARSPGVDFASYETFGFRGKEGIDPESPLAPGNHMFNVVTETASETLQKRGLQPAADDSPDLWISFYGVAGEQLTDEGTSIQITDHVTWVGDPLAHFVQTDAAGTLFIEVFDAASGERVWSGWASELAKDFVKLRKKAEKVTAKILKEYPTD